MNCNNYFLYFAGLSLACSFDDLSYRKVAAHSPIYPGSLPQFDANNALDRNLTTCTRSQGIATTSNENTVWWKVDLGGIYSIYSINILFKNYKDFENRQRGRFAGFSLNVSNNGDLHVQSSTLCYKDGPTLPPLNFTTICKEYGRYVIFYNERLNGVNYSKEYVLENVFTELCEVIIQGCEPAFYGNNCNDSCPTNCKNSRCHIEYGTCSSCEAGFYGLHCDRQCPSNCKYNICHFQHGTCSTCNHGWIGTFCNQKCKDGLYGVNCSRHCSEHCRDGVTCNHMNGQCDRGCEAGWRGTFCEKECDDRTFGYDCVSNCSGHCMNDSTCNKQNGHCEMGCNPGYTDNDCSKICSSGYYGKDCKKICSDHCFNRKQCDHVSGVCTSGCQDGYNGTHCFDKCEKGYYGENCFLVCSPNCKTCRHTDGLCTCEAGWMGHNCTTGCIKSYGENCAYTCNVHCTNQTCDRYNGSCQTDCKDEQSCSQMDKLASSDQLVIVGPTVGTIALLIIGVGMGILFLRLRRKVTQMTKRESITLDMKLRNEMEHETSYAIGQKYKNEHTNDVKIYVDASNEKTKRGPPTKKFISVRNIKAQITNMSTNENSSFKTEYHDIPRGELHASLEAKKPENKVKNRYTTIYPYDHSRVIIKTITSTEGGYINASYIEDTQEKRMYIATQGPKPKTISDFWTMIWQEEVCNIVCLTTLKEGTKNKCAQYWPDINDKLQGGTLTIRHLEEKTYAEYIIRRFKIHNKSTRTDRHVTMFHYTTWSDHGVADPLSLVVFHRHVIRATASSARKYTVVHCSAGVGRTGTYIALDALYREGERTGKINVPMYVRTMRKDRMNMIQGDEQYKLLYLALMEAFSGPSRCMTTEKFVGVYQEQTCYANCGDVVHKSSQSSEFEELLSLRKEYTQQDYTSGRAHTSANYTQSVLPVEEFMCHLSYIKGHNTYYNAVLLQSYLEKESLISAQYPLPDTTEDFLRLVKDFDARVVVFLCPLKDIESTPAWFPTENQSKLNGLFFIKNISSTKASNVTMTKLNIHPQEFSEMNITVVECPTWREGKGSADKRVLLDVIKAVKTEKSDQEGRIVVLSSDGATRCGPFCVVYNALEQISVDREVDIFTTVRQLQVRRPEFVSTLEEYQLCHDAVAEYLLNDCVYGNC